MPHNEDHASVSDNTSENSNSVGEEEDKEDNYNNEWVDATDQDLYRPEIDADNEEVDSLDKEYHNEDYGYFVEEDNEMKKVGE